MSQKALTHQDYSVGWVCALKEEMAAAAAMLEDAEHPAATVATRMISTFPMIRFWLMVGVGGGVPPIVKLGDVVISTPTYHYPGVIQWDLGIVEHGNKFRQIGSMNKAPEALRTAITKMRAQHERRGHDTRFISILKEVQSREAPYFVSRYLPFNNNIEDVLFQADYNHNVTALNCRHCDQSKVVRRERWRGRTEIHYGLIASGNAIVKDAARRDEINDKFEENILCFEMEAAGITTSHPCLVIRGICGKIFYTYARSCS